MSTLFVDTINEKTTNNGVNIPGHVLQVVSTTKTDTFTTTSTSFTDITGMQATITPSSTQSKIYIMFTAYLAMGAANYGGMIQLHRGSTAICIPDTAGSRTLSSGSFYMVSSFHFINSVSNNFLDSPNTTSATTYKLVGRTQSSSYALAINRNGSDSDSDSVPRLASSITVMEIGA